ncbi:hypothetical protein EIP86_003065 [Pleurotus ostreatoroseus]|nr:hypothetical protein EIP86_003065 [Pleurotus ostreatoroseus]
MQNERRIYDVRTADINRFKLMSTRLPVTISCLHNVQENLKAVMATLKDLQEVGLYAQSDASPAFVSPATICNISRGLLTIAMNSIYLQTKVAYNANDTLKLIGFHYPFMLTQLEASIGQFEDHEQTFLGLDPDAYIPVALSDAFLCGISDEYKDRVEIKKKQAILAASRGASRGGRASRSASRGGRASHAVSRGGRAPVSRPPALAWNPSSSRAPGPSDPRSATSSRGTPSPRGSRGASHSRGLVHASGSRGSRGASSSRVVPASVSEDDSDSVTEPESDSYRVPTDYGDSEPEGDASERSQGTIKAGMKRKRTAREDEEDRKWKEQMQDWPEYF